MGGTIASANNNSMLYAGENILVAALSDTVRTSSSGWGISVGFGVTGISYGLDFSRSSGHSELFTNAIITAGADLDIISGLNTAVLGGNIKARDIYMEVGQDLIVQSRQNTSSADSFGFGFSTDGSFSFNTSTENREYTDTPTAIVAQDRLSIYTGDTTYLLGAVLQSEVGNLELDTGNLVFDNFNDIDYLNAISVSGSTGSGSFTSIDFGQADAGGSHAYRNIPGITFATIGAGNIRVRNIEGFDYSGLNRDIDNVQVIISREEFVHEIPGINLYKLANQIKDSLDLIRDFTERFRQLNISVSSKLALDERLTSKALLSQIHECDQFPKCDREKRNALVEDYEAFKLASTLNSLHMIETCSAGPSAECTRLLDETEVFLGWKEAVGSAFISADMFAVDSNVFLKSKEIAELESSVNLDVIALRIFRQGLSGQTATNAIFAELVQFDGTAKTVGGALMVIGGVATAFGCTVTTGFVCGALAAIGGANALLGVNRVDQGMSQILSNQVNHSAIEEGLINIGYSREQAAQLLANTELLAAIADVGFVAGLGLAIKLKNGSRVAQIHVSNDLDVPFPSMSVKADGTIVIDSTKATRGTREFDILNNPAANTKYELDNGTTFRTNSGGFVEEITYTPTLTTGTRNKLQTRVGHEGISGDNGGHAQACSQGGSCFRFNLFPQNANFNNSAYKKFENLISDAMRDPNKTVGEITVRFERSNPLSSRPDKLSIDYIIDGALVTKRFTNQAGG